MALTTSYELNTSGNAQSSIDSNLPEHFINQFSSNIFHLAQQRYSRLRMTARIEQVAGEAKRIDRYGVVDAMEKGGYNVPVQYSSTPQTSRWITPSAAYRSEMVDKFAKLRTIHSPEAELTKSFSATMGREIDYKILEGLTGDATSGKDGSSSVAVPDSSKLVNQDAYGAVAAGSTGLSFEALLKAKQYFFENESVQPDEDIVCVLTGEDVVTLLDEEKLTSGDFQILKALSRGNVDGDSIMGIKFIRTELIRNTTRIPNLTTAAPTTFDPETGKVGAGSGSLAAGARKVLFYTMNRAVALGIADDVKTKIDVIPELFHGHQVLSTLDMGAVRVDEAEALEMLIGPLV